MAVESAVMGKTTKRRNTAEAREAHPTENLLGSLLLADGVLTELNIQEVLSAQREHGQRFGEVAVRLGLAQEHHIRRALAVQYDYLYGIEAPEVDSELFMAHDPFGPRAEAIRALRSEVTLRLMNLQLKTLAVTAGRAQECGSIMAANLAIAFAQAGERTILIDATLRSPRQGVLFRQGPNPGLTSFLAARVSVKEAIFPVPGFENLSIMAAGPAVPNPQELLGRMAFAYAMETVPASYDVVIVDTPPLLAYADAQIIAARAGACVLSTRRNVTNLDDLARCRAKLEPSGALILGVVVND
jgi:protein-tyrosine kinase